MGEKMSPIVDDLSTASEGSFESAGVRSTSSGLTERESDNGNSDCSCGFGRGRRPRSRSRRWGKPGVIRRAESLSAEPDESESAEFVRKIAFVRAEKLGSMGRG